MVKKKERKEIFQPAFLNLHRVIDNPATVTAPTGQLYNPLALLADWSLPQNERERERELSNPLAIFVDWSLPQNEREREGSTPTLWPYLQTGPYLRTKEREREREREREHSNPLALLTDWSYLRTRERERERERERT